MFLFSTTSPITNMLQAVGRMDIPVKTIAIGSAIKIAMNFILIGNPNINIHGAPVSTIVMYAVMLAINLTMLLRVTEVRLNFISVFLKPFLAAAACGLSAFGAYRLLAAVLPTHLKIATVLSICVGGGFYVIVLFAVKGIAKDDVEMLPKGEKIAKVLAKFKLLG
jgi:stage V sporulation protein B